MADVFISYSKADRQVAEELAKDLAAAGFDVWWDFELYAGDDFHDMIRAEIAKAKAVIVIWSETAVASKWVRGEAAEADDHGTLISTSVIDFDARRVPINFRTLHCEPVANRARLFGAIERRGAKRTPSAGRHGPTMKPRPQSRQRLAATTGPIADPASISTTRDLERKLSTAMKLSLATAEYIGSRGIQNHAAAAISTTAGAFLVVAGGAGKGARGGEAARITVDAFRERAADPPPHYNAAKDCLWVVLDNAGEGIAKLNRASPESRVGSTVAAVILDVNQGQLAWARVGSCQTFLWRKGVIKKLELNQQSSRPRDKGVLARLLGRGRLDVEVEPPGLLTGARNELYGIGNIIYSGPPMAIEPDDVVLVATAGIETLASERIAAIIAEHHPEGAVLISTRLLEAVRSCRRPDQGNIAVAVAVVGTV